MIYLTYLYFHLSILFTYIFIYLSYLIVNNLFYVYSYLSYFLSNYLTFYLSILLYIYLIYIFIYLFIFLSIYCIEGAITVQEERIDAPTKQVVAPDEQVFSDPRSSLTAHLFSPPAQ